ncbi:O-antigen ligase family protein [Limimaricola sp.]|uniref:O-antigen ligase family protein n=1 Tax=Limimaricola sp. TaxID=2211665 RepID=UPI0025C37D0E|nr:O-antigen ligase family protein [Limimaricola sp.]
MIAFGTLSTEGRAGQSAPLNFEEVALEEKRSASSLRAASRLNSGIGWCLAALAILAAVPRGGNAPLAWLVLSFLSGLLLLVHLGLTWQLAPKRRHPLRQHPWIAVPGALVLVVILLQLAPLGGWSWGSLPAAVRPRGFTLTEGATWLGAVRWAGYAAFFATFLGVTRNARRQSRLLMVLFFGVGLHAVLGLALFGPLGDQALLGDKTAYLGFATGVFVNRNSYATFLGMGLCLGIAVMRQVTAAAQTRVPGARNSLTPRKIELLFLGIVMTVIAVTLIATASRMGIFASFLGAAVTYFLLDIKAGVPPCRTLLHLAVLVVGLGLLLFAFGGQDVVLRALTSGAESDGRAELYRQVLPVITQRWLSGFGFDSFPLAFELYHRATLTPDLVWDRAHSTYLTNWVELGLVGGTLPLLVVGAMGAQAFGNLRRRTHSFAASAAACGVVITVAVHSTVDFSLEMAGNVYLFLAIMALGVVRFGHGEGEA